MNPNPIATRAPDSTEPWTGAAGRGLALTLAGLVAVAPSARAADAAAPQATPAVGTPSTSSPASSPSASVVEELLGRIRELERRDAERARGAAAASEELVRKLQERIGELEGKVKALESGRILPEIAVAPASGPTAAELDQKLKILERKNELAAEAAAAKAKEAPQLSVGPAGFTLSSADTNFVLRIRGLVQTDTRTFFDDNALSSGNEGFFLRRARPILEGTLFRDFDFQFVPDFAGSTVQIFDANVAYRFRPELRFRVGKAKSPVGFEHSLGDAQLPFNERSFVTSLVGGRHLGAQVEGDVLGGRVSYAAGIFNSVGDGRVTGSADFGDDPEFAAKVGFQPFKTGENPWLKNFAFGVGGSYSQTSSNAVGLPSTSGGTRPGYGTQGSQQFFAYNPASGTVVADGIHWRLAPYVTYLHGPFGVMAEYIVSGQDVLNSTTLRRASLQHEAWQVSAQWVLSGEPASFTGVTPLRPFRPLDGAWGAWQLVARYSRFDADPDSFLGFSSPSTSAESASTWAVGINWWLNRNVRVLTSFSLTSFDGGGAYNPADPSTLIAPATVTRQDEKALMTRLQLGF